MPTINGTAGNDTLTGTEQNDILNGGAGDDVLNGGGGDDVLDRGPGNDTVDGGAGNDTVSYASASSYVSIHMDVAYQYDTRGGGRDTVTNVENAIGSDFDDQLVGNTGANQIDGGDGNDFIVGGGGDDVLTGGTGNDEFVYGLDFGGKDTIADLTAGDIITFSGYSSAQSVTQIGNDVLVVLSDADRITCLNTDIATVMAAIQWDSPPPAPPEPEVIPESTLLPPLPPPPGDPNTGTIYVDGNASYALDADTYLYMSSTYGGHGTLFGWAPHTLTNAGTIYIEGDANYYGDMRLAPSNPPIVVLDNSGTIVLDDQSMIAGNVIAIEDTGDTGEAASIDNSGEIYLVSSHYGATLLLTWNADTSVINSSLIGAFAPEGVANLIQMVNGGTVTNEAGGQILVEALSATAISILAPAIDPTGEGLNPIEVTNAGLIEVRSTGPNLSAAVYMEFGDLVNSGTITADVAAYMDGTVTNSGVMNGAIMSDSFLTFTNESTGVLNGDFIGGDYGADGAFVDRVTNAGLINGNVALYGGDDVFVDAGNGYVVGYVDGGDGADRLTGNGAADLFYGGAGNDALIGNGGDDVLEGGGGDDTISGGAGSDMASYSEAGAGVVVSLEASGAQNTVGAGIDMLTGIEDLAGSGFGDRLTGNAAGNILFGLGGEDLLDGRAGLDLLDGGAGNDIYLIRTAGDHAGAEIADSGTGAAVDEVRFAATAAGETLRLFAGDTGIERIVIGTGTGASAVTTGTTAADVDARALLNSVSIAGNNGANQLLATAFNDQLQGGGGDDHLFGYAGNDSLSGGAGVDRLLGGIGDDTYTVTDATDYVYENAGEGTDSVIASVSYALRANVENLTLIGTANLTGKGNDIADTITGNSGANALYGYVGDDTLVGGGGRDILDGGTGNDSLQGGADNDIYVIDSTSDLIVETADGGIDFVQSSASYALSANVERMYLLGSTDIAGTGNDLTNLLVGNSGANLLSGLGANDRIYGGDGNDQMNGGDGNDYMEGGAGQDDFIGGAGKDYFVFRDGDFAGASTATADRIQDFTYGDRISVSPVDANSDIDGNQAFAFIGTASFDGTAGELRYEQTGGNTYLSGDTDGDGIADFWILLDGLHTMTAGDFIL